MERWEAFAGGIEIANAFSELNDPDEQRARFVAQREAAAPERGGATVRESFLAALEQGMPPTAGVGLGIDRLVMLLCGRRSIREVVLFPAMRDGWSAARRRGRDFTRRSAHPLDRGSPRRGW